MCLLLMVPWIRLQCVIVAYPGRIQLRIGYSIFFALVVEYIGTGAPECIFHNQLKTLYNHYSTGPGQSVFCFADKQVHPGEPHV